MVFITNWLTAMKYPYLKWQWSCNCLRMFSFLYRLLPNLTEYMSKMVGVLCQAEIIFCSVLFALFVFVLCLVYSMLIVFLDGPFLTSLRILYRLVIISTRLIIFKISISLRGEALVHEINITSQHFIETHLTKNWKVSCHVDAC
jgi:hypothetical protein